MLLALMMLLPSASALALEAAITPAPKLLRRQEILDKETPRLIGYTYDKGAYSVWDCRESSAFITSGNFGRCAETAKESFIATTCLSGSIMAGEGTSSTCTGTAAQTRCQTGTVLHYINDQQPIMNYQCWPAWDQGDWQATITTTIVSSTLSSSASPSRSSSAATLTSSSASSSQQSQTSASSVTGTSTTSPPTTSQETSNGGGVTGSSGEESKAWIAGAVIGPLAGLALVGAGFWFWWRRRQNKKNPYRNGAVELGSDVKNAQVYAYHAGQNGGPSAPPAELSGQQYAELEGSQKGHFAEADGTPITKGGNTEKP
ncbi:hypothetical protein BU24DRAFT_465815 [Aaosphaeria arxii CBS 175.79]|uniref:Mid2 domain-containing protein n=1 Tax=Aaosphaeria arxii CBS 175.79 TaxID=1450172 RepID=A0A6A5XHH5_9PLEO|nr:uncharacterized protein BU24DRAFT_465815 [Aaosphaeria arxii CBS 175.79]KAF2012261.1 hypothetical protein BU24DRAFT_465815 [Aaosphaeria arxii CBS 175.79]